MASTQIKRVNRFLQELTEKTHSKGTFIAIQNKGNKNPYTRRFQSKKSIDQSTSARLDPRGIWGSMGFDLEDMDHSWIDFCYTEGHYDWIDPKKNNYFVFRLKKSAKIYKIQPNAASLQRFFKKYGVTLKSPSMDVKIINWKKVQEDGYDGVQYVKYAKFKKNLPSWYDVIDSSAICVWNPSIISTLKKL